MGESAGGSSAMMQITAFGGLKGPAPFAQAIAQSPGFLMNPGTIQGEDSFETFLDLLNVTNLDEARKLPSEAIIAANAEQVLHSAYSTYTFGPVVDGTIMPAWLRPAAPRRCIRPERQGHDRPQRRRGPFLLRSQSE
jgi:carboxylesterase type B